MRNSEILILTEAKNTNPNGDPSNENRPRFTDDGRVEITDLRLKRYIRDYINKYVDGKEVAIKAIDEVTENNISSHLKHYVENLKKNIDWDKLDKSAKEEYFIKKYIDIPIFGIVTGSGGDSNKEIKFLKTNYYGTVQFQYGYSLNKPQLKDIDISPVTGTLGKDYRIDYGVFAFYGVVNKKTGENYKLEETIISEMDKWIVCGIPIISAESRSKIGQDVLLYIRIEYVDGNLPNDLRELIAINKEDDIKKVDDFKIDAQKLTQFCEKKKGKIAEIYYYQNEKLVIENLEFKDIKVQSIEVNI